MAVINPLCSANIGSLISDGVGGAATKYGTRKDRTYRDLDLNKYEFLPFIIETTGGFSNKAYGFCKEVQNRHKSLNCYSNDDSYPKHENNLLLSAISIEIQRANSRMILERTPLLESLIESAMVKCELAISKKKDDAIESLRLERLRPARLKKNNIMGTGCKGVRESINGGSTVHKGSRANRELFLMKEDNSNWSQGNENRPFKGRILREPMDIFELHPSIPKPLWRDEKDKDKSLRTESVLAMNCEFEAEERNMAIKSETSQRPSTFVFSHESQLSSTSNGSENLETKSGVGRKELQNNTSQKKGVLQSFQLGVTGKDREKVHWEPPSENRVFTE